MSNQGSSSNVAFQIRQNAEEYQSFLSDLTNWQSEIKSKETSAQKAYARTYAPPPVRNPVQVELSDKKEQKIKAYDYRGWDKFDVDKACGEDNKENLNDQFSVPPLEDQSKTKGFVTAEDVERAVIEKEKGNAHFQKSDYKKAIICYTRGLSFDPDNAVLFTNRAMGHLKLQRWNDAIQDCTKAIDLEPKAVKAYWRRGTAKIELGKLKEGCEDLRMASVLDPTNKSIKTDYQNSLEKLNNRSAKTTAASPTIASSSTTHASHISVSHQQKDSKKSAHPVQRRRLVIKEIGSPGENISYSFSNTTTTSTKDTSAAKLVTIQPTKKPIETLEIIEVTKPFKKKPIEIVEAFNMVEERKATEKLPSSISIVQTSTEREDKNSGKNCNQTLNPVSKQKNKKIIIQEIIPEETSSSSSLSSSAQNSNLLSTVNSKPTKASCSFTIKEAPKTMVDFERDWKSIHRDGEALYEYIKLIEPSTLPSLLKSAFESSYLVRIGEILCEFYINQNTDLKGAYDILFHLSQVPRFDMNVMFLSRKEKQVFQQAFETLTFSCDSFVDANSMNTLKKKYGI